jgi:hypothetical protein
VGDHELVALLENVKRETLAWEENYAEREKRNPTSVHAAL